MILALDTSGDELLVALVEDGRMVAGAVHPGGRHQDWVRSAIVDLAGESLAGVEALAVGRGPGSHTGLRVGLAAAAGIAFGRRLPIYPLSSLSVAAQRIIDGQQGVPLLALVAAGRGRAHRQEFASHGARRSPTGARLLVNISEIDAGAASVAAEPAVLAQLSGARTGEIRGGAEALAAAVNQAVGAKEMVNYDQLSGDYGDL